MTQKYPNTVGALFAGTFNPFTIGHADIVRRGLELFGRVVICLGVNMEKPDVDAPMRAIEIGALYADEPRVTVQLWAGLTVEAAQLFNCSVLLRGVRSVKDFEYERGLADINRRLSGIETVLLMAKPELSFVSSSMVRELIRHDVDATPYLPKKV